MIFLSRYKSFYVLVLSGDLMGVTSGQYNISLDCRDSESNVSFVSHAHSDHTSGIKKNIPVLASDATKALLEVRTKHRIKLEKSIAGAKLLDAGHVLGSRQLRIHSEELGAVVTYSGDYQMQESDVAGKIETMETDVLIVDSTYPYKEVKFDERCETVSAIQKYIDAKLEKGIVLFGAYTLGKAQELIRIANEVGAVPVTSERIEAVNKVYRQFGVRLDSVSLASDESEFSSIVKGNFMGIVEMHKLNETKRKLAGVYGKKVYTAVATGFAKMFSLGADVQFALSDHADFSQATSYIDSCSPKVVYTYGTNRKVFADNLASEGYNAHPFEKGIEHSAILKSTIQS